MHNCMASGPTWRTRLGAPFHVKFDWLVPCPCVQVEAEHWTMSVMGVVHMDVGDKEGEFMELGEWIRWGGQGAAAGCACRRAVGPCSLDWEWGWWQALMRQILSGQAEGGFVLVTTQPTMFVW